MSCVSLVGIDLSEMFMVKSFRKMTLPLRNRMLSCLSIAPLDVVCNDPSVVCMCDDMIWEMLSVEVWSSPTF